MIGLDEQQFARIAEVYCQRYPVSLWACNGDGLPRWCAGTDQECLGADGNRLRSQALSEGLRWGEPSLRECAGVLVWGLPLMMNRQVLGGLIAAVRAERAFTDEGAFLLDLGQAMRDILALSDAENITNVAALQQIREAREHEQRRAEAIHDGKARYAGDVLEAYLREEPALMTAIRQGRRRDAVGILNRILTLLYGYAGDRLEIVKSLILELVVAMSRSAVLSGGSPTELLGAHYGHLTQLGLLEDEEELNRWLVATLQRIMESVGRKTGDVALQKLQQALAWMGEHLDQDLGRDRVARVVDLSPAHFSRLLKEKTGHSFTEQLTKLRINRAMDLLVQGRRGVLDIALSCGFSDQSYFTRVFRRATGLTPAAYRKAQRRP